MQGALTTIARGGVALCSRISPCKYYVRPTPLRYGPRCMSTAIDSSGQENRRLLKLQLKGIQSEDQWLPVAESLPLSLRDALIECMLERGLATFKVTTIESVLLLHAKTLLVDCRARAAVHPKRVADIEEGCSSGFKGVIEQLHSYLQGASSTISIKQFASILWASLTISPHLPKDMVVLFTSTYSHNELKHLDLDTAVFLCEALNRNCEDNSAGGILLALLIASLTKRVDGLSKKQALKLPLAACVVRDCTIVKAFCVALDECLSSHVAGMTPDDVARLCAGYLACGYSTALPISDIIVKHAASGSWHGAYTVFRYLASQMAESVQPEVVEQLGKCALAGEKVISVLSSLRAIVTLSCKPHLQSVCNSVMSHAVAVIDEQLDRHGPYEHVQLLEVFVQSGRTDWRLMRRLANSAIRQSDALHEVSAIKLVCLVANVASRHMLFRITADGNLAVDHPFTDAHRVLADWLRSQSASVFQQRVDMLPSLCLAMRMLQLTDANGVFENAIVDAERVLQHCRTAGFPVWIHHTAYMLASLAGYRAVPFLEMYAVTLEGMATTREEYQQLLKQTNGDVVMSVMATLYASPHFQTMSEGRQKWLRIFAQESSQVGVALAAQTWSASGRTVPPNLEAVLKSYGDAVIFSKQVLIKLDRVVHPVMVLCIDEDGLGVSKDLFLGAQGPVLEKAEFSIDNGLRAVAIMLFSAHEFAAKTKPLDLLYIDTDHPLGRASCYCSLLRQLGYFPLPLCLEQFAYTTPAQAQHLFQKKLANIVGHAATAAPARPGIGNCWTQNC